MDALDDDSCRDLKKDIRTNARGNGRAAFLILERECSENNSDLDQGAKITEWWRLTVEKDIAIKKSCLIEFNRLLTAKNSELTAPFDMDKWTEKFLQSIKRPSALATQARSLLAIVLVAFKGRLSLNLLPAIAHLEQVHLLSAFEHGLQRDIHLLPRREERA